MKIHSFMIKNFRSIKEISEIPISNLITFIGRNNAGKSNILKALALFFSNKKPSPTDIPYFISSEDVIILSVTFSHSSRQFRRKLGIADSENLITLTKHFPISKSSEGFKIGTVKEFLNTKDFKDYKDPFGGITQLRHYLSKHLPKFYYVPALRSLADEGTFKRGSLIQDLILPLLDDSLVDDGDDLQFHLDEISRIIKDRCLSVEADLSSVLTNRVDDFNRLSFDLTSIDIKKALSPIISVIPKAGEEPLSAMLQGAGTQNFIILALAQYYARGKTPVDLVIAFEEPEISLHPTAQRNMLNLILDISRNNQQQVLLTTHSTIFIDQVIDTICLVKKQQDQTVVTIPDHSKEIITQLGVRGSDYLTSDAIVFVEGSSDYEVEGDDVSRVDS